MKILIALLALVVAAQAAVEGTVINGTTTRPQAGVEVTLVKLEQGMTPVGTTRSDAAGKFRFEQDVASAPLMLRAEFDGVSYTERVTPGTRAADVQITVYKAVGTSGQAGAPEQHVLLLEPSGSELIVNESFMYRNDSRPAVTYVASKQGTLRFYLPPESKGVVQASGTGPAGMPLRVSAEKTSEPDIYEVNLPIKPGENRIDLTYAVPYTTGMEFAVRTLYVDTKTRVAAPDGVTLTGEGLKSLGQEPQSKASIFDLGTTALAKLTIAGEGRLSRREADGGGEGEEIAVIPAAVQQKTGWILALAAAILAAGFYALYTAQRQSAAPPSPRNKPKK